MSAPTAAIDTGAPGLHFTARELTDCQHRSSRCATALRVDELSQLHFGSDHTTVYCVASCPTCEDWKACPHQKDIFNSTHNSRRRVHAYLWWKAQLGLKFPIPHRFLDGNLWKNLEGCEFGTKPGNGHAKVPGKVCVNPFHYRPRDYKLVYDALAKYIQDHGRTYLLPTDLSDYTAAFNALAEAIRTSNEEGFPFLEPGATPPPTFLGVGDMSSTSYASPASTLPSEPGIVPSPRQPTTSMTSSSLTMPMGMHSMPQTSAVPGDMEDVKPDFSSARPGPLTVPDVDVDMVDVADYDLPISASDFMSNQLKSPFTAQPWLNLVLETLNQPLSTDANDEVQRLAENMQYGSALTSPQTSSSHLDFGRRLSQQESDVQNLLCVGKNPRSQDFNMAAGVQVPTHKNLQQTLLAHVATQPWQAQQVATMPSDRVVPELEQSIEMSPLKSPTFAFAPALGQVQMNYYCYDCGSWFPSDGFSQKCPFGHTSVMLDGADMALELPELIEEISKLQIAKAVKPAAPADATINVDYEMPRVYPTEGYEEGDVVGFFEDAHGRTAIQRLTRENHHLASNAGVISRSAYLRGNVSKQDDGAKTDVVCLVGYVDVKLRGSVVNGALVYTDPNGDEPGVAVAWSNDDIQEKSLQFARDEAQHHILLGQVLDARGATEPDEKGICSVKCVVSVLHGASSQAQSYHRQLLTKELREMINAEMSEVQERDRQHTEALEQSQQRVADLERQLQEVRSMTTMLVAELSSQRSNLHRFESQRARSSFSPIRSPRRGFVRRTELFDGDIVCVRSRSEKRNLRIFANAVDCQGAYGKFARLVVHSTGQGSFQLQGHSGKYIAIRDHIVNPAEKEDPDTELVLTPQPNGRVTISNAATHRRLAAVARCAKCVEPGANSGPVSLNELWDLFVVPRRETTAL